MKIGRAEGKSLKDPRALIAKIKALESGLVTSMQFNSLTGEMRLLDSSGKTLALHQVATGVGQVRRNGSSLSILASVPVESPAVIARVDLGLTEYDTVVAVDATPSKEVEGRAVIVLVQLFSQDEVNGTSSVRFVPSRILDVLGAKLNSEKVGWYLACQEVANASGYREGERVVIITDAFLGEHEAINSRSSPAFPTWHLPPGFQLAYGKDKSPSDSPAQRAIAIADSVAHDYLRQNPRVPEFKFATAHPAAPYESLLRWAPVDVNANEFAVLPQTSAVVVL